MAKEVVKRLRDLSSGRTDLMMIDPKIIKVEAGHNPRDYSLPENRQHLDQLKTSIREDGVIVPLLVRYDGGNKQAILVDGECRLSAVLELIAEGVPILTVKAIQVEAGNAEQRQIIALQSNTGKALSLWELGGSYKKLLGWGWTHHQIGAKLGVTVTHITNAVDLAEASIEVKQLLSARAVSPQLALQEVRKSGDGAAKVLKAKAQVAKANGKKTAKVERVTKESEWEKLGRKIYASVEHLVVAMEEKGSEQYEWLEIGTPLVKKLALLCNGVKAKK